MFMYKKYSPQDICKGYWEGGRWTNNIMMVSVYLVLLVFCNPSSWRCVRYEYQYSIMQCVVYNISIASCNVWHIISV